MLITENWPYLLDPGIREVFEVQREALAAQSLIPLLFNVGDSKKYAEYDLSIGGMDDFQTYIGRVERDEIEQLWRTEYIHEEYTKMLEIERKLAADDMYNVMNTRSRSFAIAAMRTREKHAAGVFNNSTTAGDTAGADGVGLVSNSHPLSPSNASVQDNYLALSLTYDNVVTARQTMRTFTDDRGEIISVNPKLILVPPELENAANEITNTMRGGNTQQPGTANYEANLLQDKGFNYVVWDYLTDSNRWFLIDMELSKLYLNWFDREPLDLILNPVSGFQLIAAWRGYMRYSFGWSDWRWVIGSEPS